MSERNNHRARSSRKAPLGAREPGDHLTLDQFPTRDEVLSATAPAEREPHVHGPHPVFDHFPSRDELREAEAHFGIERLPDPEMAWLRFHRHLNERGLDIVRRTEALTELTPRFSDAVGIKPWMIEIFTSIFRSRADHRTLSRAQRQRFNDAIQEAHADGSYQALAAVHANMSHNMHSIMGSVGTQRFLPWHRIYLLQMEDLLRSKAPGVTIPYWKYEEDGSRPDWVWRPPQVQRPVPGGSGALPTTSTVTNILNNTAYTAFTEGVEFQAHNQVHNWCGGTVRGQGTAAEDPIFWLLHGNVDRIWDLWQLTHAGVPSLAGTSTVMDPWSQTASNANDVIKLGYFYR